MDTKALTPRPLATFAALAAALALALALTACGGGGDDGAGSGGDMGGGSGDMGDGGGDGGNTPEQPAPPVSNELKLELLAGSFSTDFYNCRRVDGEGSNARFMHLLQAVARSDGVYLVENDEGCQNAPPPIDANGVAQPRATSVIRKVTGSSVQQWKALGLSDASAFEPPAPPTVRHASGFHLSADGQNFWVTSYVAARSATDFLLFPHDSEMARYDAAPWAWKTHVPGVFHGAPSVGDVSLFAGAPGQRPTFIDVVGPPPGSTDSADQQPTFTDGIGQSAHFATPHALEADANGLLYLIDNGRIRTVDPVTREVRTLDHAALGITGRHSPMNALNADAQGRIHALERIGTAHSAWYRLSDGRRVEFGTQDAINLSFISVDTFAIVGDDMVLARRKLSGLNPEQMGRGRSELFRISANGKVTRMAIRLDPSLGNVTLPQIQHLEYGPDGHLYVVLPQGLMVARNFR